MAELLDDPLISFMMNNHDYEIRLHVIVNGLEIAMTRMSHLKRASRCFYWETLANASTSIVTYALDEMKAEIDRG